MCSLKEKITNSPTVEGYKFVYKTNEGKYLSMATGIEYKVGPVPIPTETYTIGDYYIDEFNSDDFVRTVKSFAKTNRPLRENYLGYTAVYVDILDCIAELNDLKKWATIPTQDGGITVIKMTLGDKLTHGVINQTTNTPIYAGKTIIHIEELKL